MLASRFGGLDWWSSYYLGHWKYEKKRNVLFKILLYILCAGLPGGILVVLIPHYVEDFYGAYFSMVVGIILAGMAISFLVPLIAHKMIIIHRSHNSLENPTVN